MILAVDPGVKACGCALFSERKLVKAWYGSPDRAAVELCGVDQLYVEMPRIYPGSGQRKGDLNDLLDLAAVVGRVEGLAGGAFSRTRVFPVQWKGQVPKPIMTKRILSRLALVEVAKIEGAGSKDHNTIDAIGIGLHFLGRL